MGGRLILAAMIGWCGIANAAELPAGATLLDGELIWDMWDPEDAIISPDGKKIAYISRGAIWACSVAKGPPTKLADLPNTTTAFLAMPEFRAAGNNFRKLRDILGYHSHDERVRKPLVDVLSLRWTPSQDGVVYGLRQRWQSNAQIALHRVMHASLDTKVTELARIERDVNADPHSFDAVHVTANKEFVVCYASGRPLIWNVATKSPKATCYDYLLPSTTSGRFLGIELDTRQLVLVDEKFGVAKRFELTFSPERQCDLFWSADERYAICRQHHEHPSMRWSAYRIDLSTGEKRSLQGPFVTDRFELTGRRGECVVSGVTGVRYDHLDRVIGARIIAVPEGDGEPKAIARYKIAPQPSLQADLDERFYYPQVRHNPDYTLFAMAIPRDGGRSPSYLNHLHDWHGTTWPMGADDRELQIAPFHVLGFGDGGRVIVGRDESKLFSIPVASILASSRAKQEDD